MRFTRFGILLLLFLFLFSGCRPTAEKPLSLIFLDVGQGNATLLQTPKGNILVDCGPENAQETLCRKLQARGIRSIKAIILTHPDEDHIGGADLILERFSVEQVLYNGATEENESFLRFQKTAKQQNIPMEALDRDDEVLFGALKITVFCPIDRTAEQTGNQGSLVFRVEYQTVSALFMGDAEESVEEELLQTYGASGLAATVLQVGHHGSATSSSPEFLAAVSPTYAVISCGAKNRYGHPDGRVLERLKAVNATVLRTDLEGDIVLQWNGESLKDKIRIKGNRT